MTPPPHVQGLAGAKGRIPDKGLTGGALSVGQNSINVFAPYGAQSSKDRRPVSHYAGMILSAIEAKIIGFWRIAVPVGTGCRQNCPPNGVSV